MTVIVVFKVFAMNKFNVLHGSKIDKSVCTRNGFCMSGSRLSTSCVNVFLVKPTAVSFFTATTCKKQPHRVGMKEQTTQKKPLQLQWLFVFIQNEFNDGCVVVAAVSERALNG